MKKLKLFFLIVTLVLISCERDDICAEGTATTPRLLIEFYDFADQEEIKVVPRLTIYGEGLVIDDEGNPTQPTESSNATILYNENASAASLPLLVNTIDGEETTIRFVLEKETNLRVDDDETTVSNEDILELTYTSEAVYVSRACGYKSIFNALGVEEVPESDDGNWIVDTQVDIDKIENETTVHVRIFH